MQQEDIKKLNQADLVQKIKEIRAKNQELTEKIRKADERTAKVSKESEAEEEFLANKLMKRLADAEKERDTLIRRVQVEEENIQNNLKKKLREISREKVDLQNQLEREQEYITHKLSKQLRDSISEKNTLQNKMEAEHKATEELKNKITEEEKQLKQALQQKVQQLQNEKNFVEALSQKDVEAAVNKMTLTLEKLASAKKELEEKLLKEVKEKQDLVLALSKEKHSLTHELQRKIKEIKKEKMRLRKQIRAQSDVFTQSDLLTGPTLPKESLLGQESELAVSEAIAPAELPSKIPSWDVPIKPSRNIPVQAMHSQEMGIDKEKTPPVRLPPLEKFPSERTSGETGLWRSEIDPRVSLWQRDKELYDAQNKTMLHQIMVLTIQLDEAKQRINKFKRLLDDLRTSKLTKAETLELAEKIERKGSEIKTLLDSSLDSLTESSIMSGESSYRERSESTDLKTSFDLTATEAAKKMVSSSLTPRKDEKQSI